MSQARRAASSGGQIVDARVQVLQAVVDDEIAMSFAALPRRTMVLVEIETAQHLIGYGESWANFPSWAFEERVATFTHGVFPLILGEASTEIDRIREKLMTHLEPLGRQWGAPGPIVQAVSAVDIALWDLAGKADHRSVADVVGRIRDEVQVYASSVGPEHVAEQVERATSAGHTAVKVKIGFGRASDEAALIAAREVGGADLTIYADANQAWSLAEAIAMAVVLRRYGVEWVEEPIRGNPITELEAFHRATGLSVATGENVYGRRAFEAYAASPGVQILQPDVSKTGGLTDALAICEMARSRGKNVIPHLFGGAVAFAATLQLAGCGQSISAIEYDFRSNPLRDPLWIDPPLPIAGAIAIPAGPGLAISLDREAMRPYSTV